jgi:hypothetical protein
MHDLADPIDAALGVLGLAIPNAPPQPLNFFEDHRFRLRSARIVCHQAACCLRRVLEAHREAERVQNGWCQDPGIDQDGAQTGTAIRESGHHGCVGCVFRRKAASDSDPFRPLIPTQAGHRSR